MVRGWRLLWEWAEPVQFVHAVHGALVGGLGVVDGAYSSGQRWRGVAEALVYPGPIAHAVQLALHLSSQVAVGPVVQALHPGRRQRLSCMACWSLDQRGE